MNPKLLVLRLLLDPSVWKEYRQYVSPKGDKHLETMYRLLDQTHESLDRVITLDEFKSIVHGSGATERDKDRDIYEQYLKILSEADVGPDLLHTLLVQVKQRDVAEKLAIAAFDFAEGKIELDKVSEIYNQFENIGDSIHDLQPVTDDLHELLSGTVERPGLRWRLASLNQSLGSLRKGDFGFVFARPETGKTTFLASEVSYFAEQAESPIIWINNEEQGSKVAIRVRQASLGVKLDKLREDREHAQQEFIRLTKGNIRIFDEASFNRRQVEDLCVRLKPSLVVIDQIDKIKGFAGDREDLKLGAIYQWARELAKEHCPVIGVCQADGTGEGVKWLNMGHVSAAKTSKQAEADFIIGIGRSTDQNLSHMRYINISKNKLQGDSDTIPTNRHGFFEVYIDAEVARYRDVGT